ncbi:hypothetical protein ACO0QE_002415 [Hanseniaspora vineae]
MSLKRLVTFHGQGSIIEFSKVAFHNISINHLYETQYKSYCEQHPNLPQSLVILSHLLYKDLASNGKLKTQHKETETFFLGHSLGELQSFLNGNDLVSLKDAIDIANYRHLLMKQQVAEYQTFLTSVNNSPGPSTTSNEMQMVALLLTKKFNLTNPDYISSLQKHLAQEYKTLAVSNINTESSVVISGTKHELDKLLSSPSGDLNFSVPKKYKILENPDKIAFHNNKILRDLQEPLYDYIWNKLKDNKTHTVALLNNQVITNYQGKLVSQKDDLLENFVKQSCNTVQFIECCKTARDLQIDEFTHVGPVPSVLQKMVERNLSELQTASV